MILNLDISVHVSDNFDVDSILNDIENLLEIYAESHKEDDGTEYLDYYLKFSLD